MASDFNLDICELELFNRLNVLTFDQEDSNFLINIRARKNDKCFLTNKDLNLRKFTDIKGIKYQKPFCKLLADFARYLQVDAEQMKATINKYIYRIKEDVTTIIDDYSKKLQKTYLPNYKPLTFFYKFHQKQYEDDNNLIRALEKIIYKWDLYESFSTIESFANLIQDFEKKSKIIIAKLNEDLIYSIKIPNNFIKNGSIEPARKNELISVKSNLTKESNLIKQINEPYSPGILLSNNHLQNQEYKEESIQTGLEEPGGRRSSKSSLRKERKSKASNFKVSAPVWEEIA